MTDRIPQIGDVIMSRELYRMGRNLEPVTAANVDRAKTLVLSGRWVIVEPKESGEQR